jgi:hypothetical protein
MAWYILRVASEPTIQSGGSMQQRTQLTPEGNRRNDCCSIILIGVILIIGLNILVPVLTSYYSLILRSPVSLANFSPLIVAAGVAALMGLLIYLVLRRMRFQRYLAQHAQPTVVVSNHPLCMGERFVLEYTIPAQHETEIVNGTVMLTLREVASYVTGMGTQRRTYTVTYNHKIAAQSIPHIAATGGIPQSFTWDVVIPLTAMHTFSTSNNKILWFVMFDLQVLVGKRSHKYFTRFPLMVLAQIAGG